MTSKVQVHDAKNRSRVLLPDGRTAVLTYCPPPARWGTKGNGSSPGRATVRFSDGRFAHINPDLLIHVGARRGDRVIIHGKESGNQLAGVFIESDDRSVTIEIKTGHPSKLPRAIINRVEVIS